MELRSILIAVRASTCNKVRDMKTKKIEDACEAIIASLRGDVGLLEVRGGPP